MRTMKRENRPRILLIKESRIAQYPIYDCHTQSTIKSFAFYINCRQKFLHQSPVHTYLMTEEKKKFRISIVSRRNMQTLP